MARLSLAMMAVTWLLAGCGLVKSTGTAGVTVTVTRDFGRQRLSFIAEPAGARAKTVLQLLERSFRVQVAPGGSVQAINGQPAPGSAGRWFFYVNGIAPATAPKTTSVHPGDRVWWDLHDASASRSVPAVVGAFPEPFVHGAAGKRFPATIECAPDVTAACSAVAATLSAAGVATATQELGTGSGQDTIGVVIGTWRELQPELVASLIEAGPSESGVYARFGGGGRWLDLLGPDGRVVRTLAAGAGLLAATRDVSSLAPTWLVTGTDVAGVTAAARALTARQLRDQFALAVDGGADLGVPQPAG